jgi:hypothetical protein
MALKQIPKEKKEAYNAVVKDLKEQVDITQKRAQKFEREGLRDKELNSWYKRIAASNVYLETVRLYCKMNGYSIQIMEIKNDLYLSNARKNIYQAIKMIESIVGTYVDVALTDNSEVLEKLSLLSPKRLLHLAKKMQYCIALVEIAEGDTSKWKWNFVEIYGKWATMMKNLINFKVYANKMYDPSDESYNEINDLMRLAKDGIEMAAQKYRTKYELSTRDVSDMNKGIELLNVLVRIFFILNEQEKAQEAKKTIEKWKDKLELDLRKREEETKKTKQAAMDAKHKKGKG